MKLLLLFLILKSLFANENWIAITPSNKNQTPKASKESDINLSQIEPINKIIKNATVVKQLLDATKKEEEPKAHEKNWFILKESKGH